MQRVQRQRDIATEDVAVDQAYDADRGVVRDLDAAAVLAVLEGAPNGVEASSARHASAPQTSELADPVITQSGQRSTAARALLFPAVIFLAAAPGFISIAPKAAGIAA
ncbi:MAG TPA: hypothetical protein VHK24_09020, partial [Steroidobacter sp.]|nr:hypothetical protein [Steroidobacter sp.]